MTLNLKTFNVMSELTQKDKTSWIKGKATELGFLDVGIAKAEFLKEEADRLTDWLSKGYQGKMEYLENHFEKRTDPRKLVKNAKSVISLAYNYFPEDVINPEGEIKISKYAYGRDYHKVVKKKLKYFFKQINEKFGPVEGRFFVDSAPVMEREWALRAGLGWIGRNTLIINPRKGSFFFLAEIIIDVELDYDEPMTDYCGSCTKCVDACPTDAILGEGYVLDASKCISYATIELKDEYIPEAFSGQMEGWAFGCDICQDVCPWNRFSNPHEEKEFLPSAALKKLNDESLKHMTEEQFGELFEGSPVKRTGYAGLARNIDFVTGTNSEEE